MPALTGGFVERGVKNPGTDVALLCITYGGEEKNILFGKHQITGQARGGHWKPQVPKEGALKFF